MAPTESSPSSNSPNLPLLLGLISVGIVLLLGVVVFSQRWWRRSQTVRQVPFSDFVVDSGTEKSTGIQHSRRSALSPLLVQNMPTENTLQSPDPFDPYEPPRSSGMENRVGPRISEPEGVAPLHEEQRTTPTISVPDNPSNVSPSVLPVGEEPQARRASLSPQDLPPLITPLSLKAKSIPATHTIYTLNEENSTVAPDPSRHFSTQTATHRYERPPSPITPESSDSDVDTVSLYSQFSASTRAHRDLERRETPPPVPYLPIGLISQRSLRLGENRRGDEDETFHRMPTSVISGLLKSRAQKSGLKRQFSQVSHIERSNSISSHRDSEANTPLPSRRGTSKRRMNRREKVAEIVEKEQKPEARQEEPPTIRSLPNPFESAVSTPPSPSTTLSSLPCERFVPSYQTQVTKSHSFMSHKAKISRLHASGEPF